ncbi:YbdD/YjiX family protein [Nocardia higoensis]|uniref:YbdD/YjiX family protein n=1 Tax=Nocardia higoensis TaxID=228599 RepID=A0ABS0DA53_9NOCA|nr:YbdD/YjiX family protein [Nocardia higoensis]MBF6355358.1 YbdD/YjiX family protein [Nocardia higoensis]
MSAERAGAASRCARPGPARRARAAVRAALWWLDSVVGGQDYQRYVAHLRRRHPDRPVPTEREYWRERHAYADNHPAGRCC